MQSSKKVSFDPIEYRTVWELAAPHQRSGQPYGTVAVAFGLGDKLDAPDGLFVPFRAARAAVLSPLDKRAFGLDGGGGRFRLHLSVQSGKLVDGEAVFAGNAGGQFDLAKEPRGPSQVFKEISWEAGSLGGQIAAATGGSPSIRAPFAGVFRRVRHEAAGYFDVMVDDVVVFQIRFDAEASFRFTVMDDRRVAADDVLAEIVDSARYMAAEPWASGTDKPTRRPTMDRRIGDRVPPHSHSNMLEWGMAAWRTMCRAADDPDGFVAEFTPALCVRFPAIQPGPRSRAALLNFARSRNTDVFDVSAPFDGEFRIEGDRTGMVQLVVVGEEETFRLAVPGCFATATPAGPVQRGGLLGRLMPVEPYEDFDQLVDVLGGPDGAAMVTEVFLEAATCRHGGAVMVPTWLLGGVPEGVEEEDLFLDLRAADRIAGLPTFVVAGDAKEIDFALSGQGVRVEFAPSGRQFASRQQAAVATPVTL